MKQTGASWDGEDSLVWRAARFHHADTQIFRSSMLMNQEDCWRCPPTRNHLRSFLNLAFHRKCSKGSKYGAHHMFLSMMLLMRKTGLLPLNGQNSRGARHCAARAVSTENRTPHTVLHAHKKSDKKVCKQHALIVHIPWA